MKDKLEKYIIENREAFDIHEPGEGVWKKIEKNIQPKRSVNWRTIIWRAAAVVLIFAASYMVHDLLDGKKREIARSRTKKEKELVIPELREAEIYYSTLINEKLQEIKPMFSEDPMLEKEIRYDLNQLDSIYRELKNDLRDNIANQEVIEAMIQNYRMRLNILEDILSQLKPEENDNHSKYNSYDM
ncbi:MAG: hypothetical protein JW723_04280 [Bacteroidales bacterium]|nr:hypothetical protein [Bacteroidales bacterium]